MQFPSPRIGASSNRSNIDKLNLSSSSSFSDHSDSVYISSVLIFSKISLFVASDALFSLF